MNVKKIGAQAAIVGTMAVTAVAIGAGVASADQAVPDSPGMVWKLDKPHHGEGGEGRDWDDDWDGWRGDWDAPRWGPAYYGPCVWVPPAVSAWVPPAVC